MSGTTAGTTSGAVLGYSYRQRQVLDHAFRKAGRKPEDIGSEWIVLAQDLLFLQLSEYVNAGFPLWTRQQLLLPIKIGGADAPLPYGTVDVLHGYWRTFMPWRGAATTTGNASAAVLFAGQPNSDLTIPGSNPGVIVNYGSAIEVDTIGVLPGLAIIVLLDGYGNPILDGNGDPILVSSTTRTGALELWVSDDGVTYTLDRTLPSTTFTRGVWAYQDLEPSITTQYLKIVFPGTLSWVVNQLNTGLANSTQVDVGLQNIDDYYDLPNKFMRGSQVNTVFVDRQRDSPIIKIWPTPNIQAFYGGTVVALSRRYIQDPGSMTNSLEIPARWIEGVTSRLGVRLIDELPDEDKGGPPTVISAAAMVERRKNLEGAAIKAEGLFWSEERPSGPLRFTPNLSAYTR